MASIKKTSNSDKKKYLSELKREYHRLKLRHEKKRKLDKIKEMIPKELFIINGKFDRLAFNREAKKMLKRENWKLADIKNYYETKEEILNLTV